MIAVRKELRDCRRGCLVTLEVRNNRRGWGDFFMKNIEEGIREQMLVKERYIYIAAEIMAKLIFYAFIIIADERRTDKGT
jgi:hypothetical protein